jgi:hypothetical protein
VPIGDAFQISWIRKLLFSICLVALLDVLSPRPSWRQFFHSFCRQPTLDAVHACSATVSESPWASLPKTEGGPPKCNISTQEQNCGPAEEFPKRLIHPDKYRLRQYLVDEPDAELRRILHLIRHQNRPLRNPEFMDQKSIVLCLNRKG